MRLHNPSLSNKLLALLTLGHAPRVFSEADLDLQLRIFALDVVPIILAGPRPQIAELFAQLRRATAVAIRNVASEESLWSSQDATLV